jgi:uncharacterized protein (TIGR01777 family)
MKTLVTGASGFIGTHLLKSLPDAVVLSTAPIAAVAKMPGVNVIKWDPGAGTCDAAAFDGVSAVVNLAGESISGRWSDEKKARILSSRVQSSELLVRSILALDSKPEVVVTSSAVGFYGDGGERELAESSPAGNGFLAEVCVKWEACWRPLVEAGVRVVMLRTGVVMGKGGALKAMERPFKLGLGGRLGGGNQWMSWISIDDLAALIVHATRISELSGPVNAVSPNPVRNSEFTKVLGRALGMPTILPVPSFALKVALGEFALTLLISQRAIPRAALASGFRFKHSNISDCLNSIYARS